MQKVAALGVRMPVAPAGSHWLREFTYLTGTVYTTRRRLREKTAPEPHILPLHNRPPHNRLATIVLLPRTADAPITLFDHPPVPERYAYPHVARGF